MGDISLYRASCWDDAFLSEAVKAVANELSCGRSHAAIGFSA